jgi:hypothetical protein
MMWRIHLVSADLAGFRLNNLRLFNTPLGFESRPAHQNHL